MTDTIHQVTFVGVKESYPVGSAIECRYVLKTPFAGTSRDWIGLYKVGWLSPDQYETYVWVLLPPKQDDSETTNPEGVVTFPGDTVPMDSGEFYQFCYVSSNKTVCGASTPFQVCSAMDDLIEVQDPDDPNTMVVKTKYHLLEEQMVALKKHCAELEKDIKGLHVELDAERLSKGQLIQQLQAVTDLEENLNAEMKVKENLYQQIKELQDTLQTERRSNEQLHSQLRALRDELLEERKSREDVAVQSPEKEVKDNTMQTIGALEEHQDLAEGVDQLRLSAPNADHEIGQSEESVGAAASDSMGEDGAKQMSFTERIAGSVLKQLKRASDWLAEDFDDEPEAEHEAKPQEPTAEQQEELLTACPVCGKEFLSDASAEEISEHVESHNGQVCPVCYMQFDRDYPEDDVTCHVNRHFENPGDVLSF